MGLHSGTDLGLTGLRAKDATLALIHRAWLKLHPESIPTPRRARPAAASHNPQALLRSCLQPLLAAPGLNQHQAELLTRLAKGSLPPSLLPELLIAACGGSGSNAMPHTGGPHAEPAVPAGASWNEQSVGLLQTVLALKPDLHQVGLGSFLWVAIAV